MDVTLPDLGTGVRRKEWLIAVEVGLYGGYDLPTSSVEDDLFVLHILASRWDECVILR